ncbi:MAG: enoyl-ACP reductase [Candidatus Eisenbacteria bacterium]
MAANDLTGKNAIVLGVANHRSIAWGIAQALAARGARLCLTYQGDRFRPTLEELATEANLDNPLLLPLDVNDDAQMDAAFDVVRKEMGGIDALAHCIAFAQREDLEGAFRDTGREGWRVALEVSAYSLVALAKRATPLMEGRQGAMIALSYLAAERAVPNYNVMGSAKAALEQCVRQLALELGPLGIRVNCISAGPIATLSARGISGFARMVGDAAEKAPLKRNVTLEDIGRAGYFLLSDLSSGITGETIYVDCGYNIVGV